MQPITLSLLTFGFITLACNSAFAYIGPGIGLGALAGVFAFLAAIAVVLIALLHYSVRKLYCLLKKNKADPKNHTTP